MKLFVLAHDPSNCNDGNMENDAVMYQALEYDEERVKQLYYKTAYGKVLPKSYRPKGRVDRAAFADAMVGLYIESLERVDGDDHEAYQLGLARAAFTIDFLQGASPGDLRESLKSFAPEAAFADSREYALGIVATAAEYLRESGIMEASATGQQAPKQLTGSVTIEQSEVVDIRTFENLSHLIDGLRGDGLMSDGEAQVLLLILRQARSPLALERQVKIIDRMLPYLQGRLRRTVATQPHKGDDLEDKVFAKGVGFMRTIFENSPAMLTDNRILISFAQTELMKNDTFGAKDASRSVMGYIGYTLDKMYRVQ